VWRAAGRSASGFGPSGFTSPNARTSPNNRWSARSGSPTLGTGAAGFTGHGSGGAPGSEHRSGGSASDEGSAFGGFGRWTEGGSGSSSAGGGEHGSLQPIMSGGLKAMRRMSQEHAVLAVVDMRKLGLGLRQ
jgi:hypothetical protein